MKTNSTKFNLKPCANTTGFAALLLLSCLPNAMAQTNTFPSNGNVGVGTTSPVAMLHVVRPAGNSVAVSSRGVNQDVLNQECDGTHSCNYWGTDFTNGGNLFFGFDTANKNQFVINSSGNVGIGTTSPGQKLEINGGIKLTNGNDTFLTSNNVLGLHSNGYMYFQGGSNGAAIASDSVRNEQILLRSAAAGSKIDFVTGGTVKMTLDANGNLTVNGNIAAKYQDVAEWVESSQELQAGTVVVLDSTKSNQVVASSQSYDTRVAGVISLRPGLALGEAGEDKVLVATTGRVRVKVDATNSPIQIGDLLVTGDREGVAMKSIPVDIGGVRLHRPGTLIGKALEPLAKGEGEILVLLSLQ